MHSLPRLFLLITCAAATAATAEGSVALVPQLLVGTAGFEPGLAVEWRSSAIQPVILRPEAFVNEDGRVGAGGSVLWDVAPAVSLPRQQSLAIGPRVVYHNAEETGWEADVMATWSMDLSSGSSPWRHSVGLLAAVGVREDRPEDDLFDQSRDDLALGASGGGFYAFRF
jgi:hypothetical protein